MAQAGTKLKIMLSVTGFYPHSFGGGEAYVYRLAKELLRRGHEVQVLAQAPHEDTDSPHAASRYDYNGIPVVALRTDAGAASPRERHTGFGLAVCETLRRVLRESGPDLVHINAMKPALVSVCRELGVPHVVTAHHVGIVCPAGGLLLPDGTVCSGLVSAERCVSCCTSQRWPKLHIGGLIGRIPRWLYGPVGKRLNGKQKGLNYYERGLVHPWLVEESIGTKKEMIAQANRIVAPSQYMRDLLVKNGCPPEKINVVSHGIEPLRRVSGEKHQGGAVSFGYVGRIDPGKGLHLLLEAVRLLPAGAECELHIFGAAGSRRDEEYFRKAMAGCRGRSRVVHHGLVPPDRISEAFARFDVLVVPSLLPESFGLVVLEAFSAGRPVIVADSGALSELVRHETNGLVVEPNDAAALSEAMQRYILDPALRSRMAESIPPVGDIHRHAEEITNIYAEAMTS